MKRLAVLLLCAASAYGQNVTMQFTAKLTDSGDDPPMMPVVSGATEPAEPLTPALRVSVPNANGVLTLSDGTRVIFANGTVAVEGQRRPRRRAAGR